MTDMRVARLAATLALLVTVTLASATGAGPIALPTGFDEVVLGMTWDEVRQHGARAELTRPTTAWERHLRDCGYRDARLDTGDGRLLVTTHDHVVTTIGRVTPLAAGTRVSAFMAQAIATFGQPRQATLRDELGAITTDPQRARHVLLDYGDDAEIAISAPPLQEVRITVHHADARRLENRTLRCARVREQAGR